MEGCGDMERRVPYAVQLLTTLLLYLSVPQFPPSALSPWGQQWVRKALVPTELIPMQCPGQDCTARLWVQLRGALYGNGAEHSTGRTESFRGE